MYSSLSQQPATRRVLRKFDTPKCEPVVTPVVSNGEAGRIRLRLAVKRNTVRLDVNRDSR